MNEKFKIYKLIFLGQVLINLPIIIISFGLPITAFNLFDSTIFCIIGAIIAFFIAIGTSWVIWSILITKWRIWAFNKVDEDDLILLKQLAVETKLIWEDGDIFESTETRNKSEHKAINNIAIKIAELEEIEHLKTNLNTPRQITYNMSKKDILIESCSMILALSIGISILFTKAYFLGLITIVIILFSWKNFLYLFYLIKENENLELNNKGITIGLPINKFILWESINDLDINNDDRKMMINFKEANSDQELNIDLWRYEIKDYNLFKRRIKVFADRFITRWRHRSIFDN